MRLIVTQQARIALDDILAGGIVIMGRRHIKDFYSSFKNIKSLLPRNPLMGPQELLLPDKYRNIVLHPYVKMIYSVENDAIYIHDFWNTLRSTEYLVSRSSRY